MTPEMRRLLEGFSETPLYEEYRLAGGTSMAVVLGHRRSRDLDFFPDVCNGRVPRDRIRSVLDRIAEKVDYLLVHDSEVTAMADGVKVIFSGYPYEWREKPLYRSGIRLADPREVMCMKAYILDRRSTARDYIDIRYGLREGASTLDLVIEDSKQKFILDGEVQFSGKRFLQQLLYVDDISEEDKQSATEELLDPRVTFDDIVADLREYVHDYMKCKGNGR